MKVTFTISSFCTSMRPGEKANLSPRTVTSRTCGAERTRLGERSNGGRGAHDRGDSKDAVSACHHGSSPLRRRAAAVSCPS